MTIQTKKVSHLIDLTMVSGRSSLAPAYPLLAIGTRMRGHGAHPLGNTHPRTRACGSAQVNSKLGNNALMRQRAVVWSMVVGCLTSGSFAFEWSNCPAGSSISITVQDRADPGHSDVLLQISGCVATWLSSIKFNFFSPCGVYVIRHHHCSTHSVMCAGAPGR